jgi:hypothetical protein
MERQEQLSQSLRLLEREAEYRGESANLYAQAGLRNLMLINGGAIISLLTFLGNTRGLYDAASLRTAMIAYVAGLVAAVVAHLTAYISQNIALWHVHELIGAVQTSMLDEDSEAISDKSKFVNLFILAGVLLSGVSLTAFGIGSWKTLDALL